MERKNNRNVNNEQQQKEAKRDREIAAAERLPIKGVKKKEKRNAKKAKEKVKEVVQKGGREEEADKVDETGKDDGAVEISLDDGADHVEAQKENQASSETTIEKLPAEEPTITTIPDMEPMTEPDIGEAITTAPITEEPDKQGLVPSLDEPIEQKVISIEPAPVEINTENPSEDERGAKSDSTNGLSGHFPSLTRLYSPLVGKSEPPKSTEQPSEQTPELTSMLDESQTTDKKISSTKPEQSNLETCVSKIPELICIRPVEAMKSEAQNEDPESGTLVVEKEQVKSVEFLPKNFVEVVVEENSVEVKPTKAKPSEGMMTGGWTYIVSKNAKDASANGSVSVHYDIRPEGNPDDKSSDGPTDEAGRRPTAEVNNTADTVNVIVIKTPSLMDEKNVTPGLLMQDTSKDQTSINLSNVWVVKADKTKKDASATQSVIPKDVVSDVQKESTLSSSFASKLPTANVELQQKPKSTVDYKKTDEDEIASTINKELSSTAEDKRENGSKTSVKTNYPRKPDVQTQELKKPEVEKVVLKPIIPTAVHFVAPVAGQALSNSGIAHRIMAFAAGQFKLDYSSSTAIQLEPPFSSGHKPEPADNETVQKVEKECGAKQNVEAQAIDVKDFENVDLMGKNYKPLSNIGDQAIKEDNGIQLDISAELHCEPPLSGNLPTFFDMTLEQLKQELEQKFQTNLERTLAAGSWESTPDELEEEKILHEHFDKVWAAQREKDLQQQQFPTILVDGHQEKNLGQPGKPQNILSTEQPKQQDIEIAISASKAEHKLQAESKHHKHSQDHSRNHFHKHSHKHSHKHLPRKSSLRHVLSVTKVNDYSLNMPDGTEVIIHRHVSWKPEAEYIGVDKQHVHRRSPIENEPQSLKASGSSLHRERHLPTDLMLLVGSECFYMESHLMLIGSIPGFEKMLVNQSYTRGRSGLWKAPSADNEKSLLIIETENPKDIERMLDFLYIGNYEPSPETARDRRPSFPVPNDPIECENMPEFKDNYIHLRMYVMASRYKIPALKDFAYKRIENSLDSELHIKFDAIKRQNSHVPPPFNPIISSASFTFEDYRRVETAWHCNLKHWIDIVGLVTLPSRDDDIRRLTVRWVDEQFQYTDHQYDFTTLEATKVMEFWQNNSSFMTMREEERGTNEVFSIGDYANLTADSRKDTNEGAGDNDFNNETSTSSIVLAVNRYSGTNPRENTSSSEDCTPRKGLLARTVLTPKRLFGVNQVTTPKNPSSRAPTEAINIAKVSPSTENPTPKKVPAANKASSSKKDSSLNEKGFGQVENPRMFATLKWLAGLPAAPSPKNNSDKKIF